MELAELHSKAFGNFLILEKIIGHIIFEKQPFDQFDGTFDPGCTVKLLRPEVRSLRTVAKSWSDTIDFLVRKQVSSVVYPHEVHPLFHLKVGQDNVDTIMEYDFISLMGGDSPDSGSDGVIPYGLTVDSFTVLNHPRVNELLTRCNKGLVYLSTGLAISSGVNAAAINVEDYVHPEYPPLALPNLKTFLCYDNQPNAQPKIQQILFGATTLQSLRCQGSMFELQEHGNVPNFLPPTLHEVGFLVGDHVPEETLAELLENNKLPFLKRLRIYKDAMLADFPMTGQATRRMLRPVMQTLEQLSLGDSCPQLSSDGIHCVPRAMGNVLDLPGVMANLKFLRVSTHWFITDDIAGVQLNALLPQLKKIQLTHDGQFDRWTGPDVLFPNVRSVILQKEEDEWKYGSPYYINLNPERIRAIYQTFPNVNELSLCTFGPSLEGIRCVFREMRQLKKLKVSSSQTLTGYRNNGDSVFSNSGDPISPEQRLHWDALMLGHSPEELRQLRHQFREGNVPQGPAPFPGITSLRKLKSLTLTMEARMKDIPAEESYLSDISFHQAFFKMEKLTELSLRLGRINVTSWKTLKDWMKPKGTPVHLRDNFRFKK